MIIYLRAQYDNRVAWSFRKWSTTHHL